MNTGSLPVLSRFDQSSPSTSRKLEILTTLKADIQAMKYLEHCGILNGETNFKFPSLLQNCG